MHNIDALAKSLFAYIESDGAGFRRAARTLQSFWRDRCGLPIGDHNGRPLGSRLPTDLAERELVNYLTPGIRAVVREALAAADNQLFGKPRIYNDLLSSQPLCFNLFGELKLDLNLASSVMAAVYPDLISRVTGIRFEYSPGRSLERFTADNSAFDVFIEYEPIGGGKGFLGIEVKYHEDLKVSPAPHRPRYDQVAVRMNCFKPEYLVKLKQTPLEQLWRDHLLAGSMLQEAELGYTQGKFIVLYPAANPYCRSAIQKYRNSLADSATFDAWTLEGYIAILSLATPALWVEELRTRYLDFSQLYKQGAA